MKYSKSKLLKKIFFIFLLAFIIISISTQFINDKLIYNKKGNSIGLPSLSLLFDFAYKPLKNDTTNNILYFKLKKTNPGISSNGYFSKNKWRSKCEVTIIPKLNYPQFEIKFLDKKYLNRKKSIKLYPFEKAFLAPFYGNLISDNLSLIKQEYELILLEYESNTHPYILREKYNSDLIEKQEISNGIHFKLEEKSSDYKDGYEIVLINNDSKKVKNFISEKIHFLNTVISSQKKSLLNEIFDLDYLSRYFIFCQLTGRKNLSETRWIYRLTNGKIYPISTAHNSFKKNKKNNSIWNFILESNAFKAELLNSLNEYDYFPAEYELEEIEKTHGSFLSHYKKSSNKGQRELNYLIKKDKKVLIENNNRLIEIKNEIANDFKQIESASFYKIDSIIAKLGFSRHKNTIVIKTGNYQINNNVIFPIGYNLTVNAGTTLSLNDSVSFIIN